MDRYLATVPPELAAIARRFVAAAAPITDEQIREINRAVGLDWRRPEVAARTA